eukprot:TRINITY_DN4292_c0_g1_i2.p1 TRINITY_DN4292_c0_g1~~TRINITY_DN4292_c0_g1_i2.p1  ORF type:complete len:200 (+),score=-17.39 TRINITY_DN4292_c0_g1_i2:783-1382(+)
MTHFTKQPFFEMTRSRNVTNTLQKTTQDILFRQFQQKTINTFLCIPHISKNFQNTICIPSQKIPPVRGIYIIWPQSVSNWLIFANLAPKLKPKPDFNKIYNINISTQIDPQTQRILNFNIGSAELAILIISSLQYIGIQTILLGYTTLKKFVNQQMKTSIRKFYYFQNPPTVVWEREHKIIQLLPKTNIILLPNNLFQQ